jgi:hypothetical protein
MQASADQEENGGIKLHNSVSERCRSARFVVPDFNIES